MTKIFISLVVLASSAYTAPMYQVSKGDDLHVKVTCYSAGKVVFDELVYNVKFPTASSPSAPVYMIYRSENSYNKKAPDANIAGGVCVSTKI